MTDCEKARAELEEYLHNELGAEDAAMVAQHLAECEDCRSEHRLGAALTEAVRRACRERAPEELRALVLTHIRSVEATQTV
ncbi:zf-HC2 domain-containing protein [Ruicaihuangia caeni]|uniref:zf-HC2 domain-containing protein n=1 Tax=Ruicaihuangia caeni TaxID=3042517 RepID=UPI00338FF4A3